MTPILPFIQDRLKSVQKEIEADLFLWLSGKKYPNLDFSGSLELGYWGTYLENYVYKIMDAAFMANRELAAEHDLDPANSANDASLAAQKVVEHILNKMVDYDQRMRGKGYPNSVVKKNITEIQQRYFKIIQARADNEIALLNMPKKNIIKLPLTGEHDILWFLRNCHRSLLFKYLLSLLTAVLFIFGLGFASGRNNTFVKIYDAIKSSAIIQPTPAPTADQKSNHIKK